MKKIDNEKLEILLLILSAAAGLIFAFAIIAGLSYLIKYL
ncbi:hypothetical protein B620_gp36 [Croceibacter phage P2559S]|nr:hypothetical protein B620_gp36 [Croceibacter phage P2559S]AFM54814.1 hypothetical protein P2559S_36 [Croceibacter phage P2559S]